MRFHYPSFIHQLDRRLPDTIRMMDHRFVVYLYADFPLRRDWLETSLEQSVIDSYESPLWTPDPTEEASLIKGLLEPQERTLRTALKQTMKTAVTAYRITSPGERLSAYEYHCDVTEIMACCRKSIDQADAWMIAQELPYCDGDVSVRKMQKRLVFRRGKVYSKERVNRILTFLEHEGFLSRNGGLRLYGRDIAEKH